MNFVTQMSTVEKRLLIIVSFFLFFSLVFVQKDVANLLGIDTVYFMEMIANIAKIGEPLSVANHSSHDLYPFLTEYADEYCSNPLEPTLPLASNGLDNHAYFILYAFAPFTWIIPIKLLAPILHVLPFVLFIIIIYLFLRYNGVSPVVSVLFCILVLAHPSWSQAIQGQYYVDRWFLPFGLLLSIISFSGITAKNVKNVFVVLSLIALATALIHERAALSGGAWLIALSILFYKNINDRKYFLMLMGIGAIMILYAVLISMTFKADEKPSNTAMYAQFFFSMLSNVPMFFDNESFRNNVGIFGVVNILFFGILSIFSPRIALIVFASMLPNILGHIGGAGKIGWSTHYHSFYFPFLAFATAQGFVMIYSRMQNNPWQLKKLYGFVSVAFLCQITYHHYSDTFTFSMGQVQNHALVNRVNYIIGDTSNNSQRGSVAQRRALNAAIPLGTRISTVEGYFPSLYEGRTAFHYPIGIDSVDYVIISLAGSKSDKPPSFYPPVTYLGSKNSEELGICMYERLKSSGYNVLTPTIIGHTAILKRTTK